MVLADRKKFDNEHPGLPVLLREILGEVKKVFEDQGFFIETTTTS